MNDFGIEDAISVQDLNTDNSESANFELTIGNNKELTITLFKNGSKNSAGESGLTFAASSSNKSGKNGDQNEMQDVMTMLLQKAIEDTDAQQAAGITVEDIMGLDSF